MPASKRSVVTRKLNAGSFTRPGPNAEAGVVTILDPKIGGGSFFDAEPAGTPRLSATAQIHEPVDASPHRGG